MTPFTMCLLLICAAEPTSGSAVRLYTPSPKFAAAIRGQTPDTFVPSTPAMPPSMGPSMGTPTLQQPIPVPDSYSPYSGQPYPNQDPFQAGPDPVLTSPDLFNPVYGGMNGQQPFRYGLIPRMDFGFIPQSSLRGVDAGVQMFEHDSELRYNAPFGYGWALSTAAQFGYRDWQFSGAADPLGRLNLYRFGWDAQLFTPEVNGWQWQFGFNPSINTDFNHRLTEYAWNFDGTIAAYYRVDPTMQLVMGVTVWDRLDTFVLPYAGVILNPDDRWELRLMFPKSRISYFLGECDGGYHWLYVSSEFRVDSYQFALPGDSPRNQIQYEDWRLALGLRSDHGWFDKYIEVAWVVGRNLQFRDTLPNVDVGNNVLVRAGIRF